MKNITLNDALTLFFEDAATRKSAETPGISSPIKEHVWGHVEKAPRFLGAQKDRPPFSTDACTPCYRVILRQQHLQNRTDNEGSHNINWACKLYKIAWRMFDLVPLGPPSLSHPNPAFMVLCAKFWKIRP